MTNAERTNKRKTGARYERQASEFLISRGLKLVAGNYRCGYGEIDLIAMDGDTLVFVEVKYRRSRGKGDPAEAVDPRKQSRIRKAAGFYLYANHYREDTPCRFDVVSILGEELQWIRDAF